jgi:hypothetical protein
LLADALDWSSEKWSKASGTATVGLDQVRARLSMSIPTYRVYMRSIQIATGDSRHLVIRITKMIDWSSLVGESRISGETEPRHWRAPEKIGARHRRTYA